jgi:hypothetical protein
MGNLMRERQTSEDGGSVEQDQTNCFKEEEAVTRRKKGEVFSTYGKICNGCSRGQFIEARGV